jgi:HPt (histidine-containing phosphotransfer) domain-containing protein
MSQDGAPVLDSAVIDELRDSVGGDEDFILDLVETYVTEGAVNLEGMHAAASALDAEAIVRPAHTLKSSSASLGAMRLSEICRAIEEAGRAGDAATLREDVDAARSAWDATLAAFTDAGLSR